MLAADRNEALVIWTDPIVTNNGGDGDVRLAHPPRIALRQQIEEEIALWRKVLLDEQDSTHRSNLTGCRCTLLMY